MPGSIHCRKTRQVVCFEENACVNENAARSTSPGERLRFVETCEKIEVRNQRERERCDQRILHEQKNAVGGATVSVFRILADIVNHAKAVRNRVEVAPSKGGAKVVITQVVEILAAFRV